MSNEELKTKIESVLNPTLIGILDVMNVNHKPHQYTIGPRHVAYSAEHYGGMLGLETTQHVPCAYPGGCNLSYAEHKSNRVAMIQLKRNMKHEELQKELQRILDEIKDEPFDGFTFVETPEKFRYV